MKLRRGFVLLGVVAVLFVGFQVVKVAGRQGGPVAMAVALAVLVGILLVLWRIGPFTRRHFAPAADVALTDDRRPPILFLRSFTADNEFRVRGWSLVRMMGYGSPWQTLEYALVEE